MEMASKQRENQKNMVNCKKLGIGVGVVVLLCATAGLLIVLLGGSSGGEYELTEGDVAFQAALEEVEFGPLSTTGVPLSETIEVMVTDDGATAKMQSKVDNLMANHEGLRKRASMGQLPRKRPAHIKDGSIVRRAAVRRALEKSDEGTAYSDHQAYAWNSNPQQQSTELFDYILCVVDQLNLEECPMLNREDGYIAEVDRSLCVESDGESTSDTSAEDPVLTEVVVVAARKDDNGILYAYGWTTCEMGWGDYECRFEVEITEAPSADNYFGIAQMRYAVVDWDGTLIGKANIEFGLQINGWGVQQFGALASTSMLYNYEWMDCGDTWSSYYYSGTNSESNECITSGYTYSRSDAVSVVLDMGTMDLEFQLLSNSSDHSYGAWGDWSYNFYDLSKGVSEGDMVAVRHGFAYVDDWCDGSFEDIQSIKTNLQSTRTPEHLSPPASKATYQQPATMAAHKTRAEQHTRQEREGGAVTSKSGVTNRAHQQHKQYHKKIKKTMQNKLSSQASKRMEQQMERQAEEMQVKQGRALQASDTYECSPQIWFDETWGYCPNDEEECSTFCSQRGSGTPAFSTATVDYGHGIYEVCTCSDDSDMVLSVCEGLDYDSINYGGWCYDQASIDTATSWWECHYYTPATTDECNEYCSLESDGAVTAGEWTEDSCGDNTCVCDASTPTTVSTASEWVSDDEVCGAIQTEEDCDAWCGGSGSGRFEDYSDWDSWNQRYCYCDSECYTSKTCSFSDYVWFSNSWWDSMDSCPATADECDTFCDSVDDEAGVNTTDFTTENWGWGSQEELCSCSDASDDLVDSCNNWMWCPVTDYDCANHCEWQGYNSTFTLLEGDDYDTKTCDCVMDASSSSNTSNTPVVMETCSYDDYESYDWCEDVTVGCYNRSSPVQHVYDYRIFNFDGSEVDLLTEFSFTYQGSNGDSVYGYYSQWGTWWDTWWDPEGPHGKVITVEDTADPLELVMSVTQGSLVSYDETWTPTYLTDTAAVSSYFATDADTVTFWCDYGCLRPGLTLDDLESCTDSSTLEVDSDWDSQYSQESLQYDLDLATMTFYHNGEAVVYPGDPNSHYQCWVGSMSLITDATYQDQQHDCEGAWSTSTWLYMEWTLTASTFTTTDGQVWSPNAPIQMLPYEHTLANDRNGLSTHIGTTIDFVAQSTWWTSHNIESEEEAGSGFWYPAISLKDGIILEDNAGNKYLMKASYYENTFKKQLCSDEQKAIADKEDWLLAYPDASWSMLSLPLNANATRYAMPAYDKGMQIMVEIGQTLPPFNLETCDKTSTSTTETTADPVTDITTSATGTDTTTTGGN